MAPSFSPAVRLCTPFGGSRSRSAPATCGFVDPCAPWWVQGCTYPSSNGMRGGPDPPRVPNGAKFSVVLGKQPRRVSRNARLQVLWMVLGQRFYMRTRGETFFSPVLRFLPRFAGYWAKALMLRREEHQRCCPQRREAWRSGRFLAPFALPT